MVSRPCTDEGEISRNQVDFFTANFIVICATCRLYRRKAGKSSCLRTWKHPLGTTRLCDLVLVNECLADCSSSSPIDHLDRSRASFAAWHRIIFLYSYTILPNMSVHFFLGLPLLRLPCMYPCIAEYKEVWHCSYESRVQNTPVYEPPRLRPHLD